MTLKQNIRNAYFCESLETILVAWQSATQSGQFKTAEILAELLKESMEELTIDCQSHFVR